MFALLPPIALLTAAPPPAEVQREFESLWTAAQRPEQVISDQGSFIEFDAVDQHLPAATDLAKLRDEVRLHPQHPERLRLEKYERIVRGDYPVTTIRIWKHGGSYRLSAKTSTGRDYDRALDADRNIGWEWSQAGTQQLSVFPLGPGTPAGYDFRPLMHDMFTKASAFATQGLSLAATAAPAPSLDEYAPGRVRASIEHPPGRMTVEGESLDGRLWIASIRWENPAGAEVARISLERNNDRITLVRRSEPRTEYRWRAAGTASAAEVAALIRVPEASVDDPVRGPVRIGSIDDSRGSQRVRSRVDPVTGAEVVVMTTPSTAALQRRYTWAMLAAAAAILTALAVVAVQRWRARRHI